MSSDALVKELGVSKQKVLGAIKRGLLKKARHSYDKITIDSLVSWLESADGLTYKSGALEDLVPWQVEPIMDGSW